MKKAGCRQPAFDFLVGGARFELATNGLKVEDRIANSLFIGPPSLAYTRQRSLNPHC